MDRKSFIVILISMLFIMSWYRLMENMYPQPEKTAGGTNTVSTNFTGTNALGTNAVATVGADLFATNQPAGTNSVAGAPSPLASSPLAPAPPSAEEELITLETENSRYVFTSLGGGIKNVELKKFPFTACSKDAEESEDNRLVTLNPTTPVPVGAIEIDKVLGHKTPYALSKSNGGVIAIKEFPAGLRIVKEFRPSTNYLIDVTVRFENTSTNAGTAIRLPEHYFLTGTSTPMNAGDPSLYMYLCWHDGKDEDWVQDSWFQNKFMGCFGGSNPRDQFRAASETGATEGIAWSAVMNQFFVIATIPEKPAPRLLTTKVGLDYRDYFQPTKEEKIAFPFGFQSGFGYPEQQISPGADNAVVQNYQIYVGPKEYKTFEKFGIEMDNGIDIVMDFGGFFGFFARVLLRSMNLFHDWGFTYAWSIIMITIIMKMLFWPLTNASTKSMKRMSQLQPQMKELQEKYKDNPQKMNQKLMEFMKENKVNPMGGCLPMLLQMPVFFGFFTMLRSAVELRGETFLWVCDLSASDTIFHVAGFPINPLPIIMGVTMFWQSSLQPPSPGMDPNQQKILKYMPMIFVVFLYNFSSALTLYWTVQNILTIFQTKITKASDAKKEAGKPALTAGKKAGAKKRKKN